MSEYLDLVDYRSRVAEIYRNAIHGTGLEAWQGWVDDRDRLFATHPQSPIEEPHLFQGLPYFDYDASFRVLAEFTARESNPQDIGHSGSGTTSFSEIGTATFQLSDRELSLSLLWLNAYGGGLFLPFRDLTNGESTYGGGRYLLDTAKGADLGSSQGKIVLDFNYAYHPSCVHSARWSCPLAPASNRLDIEIAAGERLP